MSSSYDVIIALWWHHWISQHYDVIHSLAPPSTLLCTSAQFSFSFSITWLILWFCPVNFLPVQSANRGSGWERWQWCHALVWAVAPHCSTQDPGGGVGSRSKGWRWVGLGVGLGIRGPRWLGLGKCKVGGVGSGSNSSSWISYTAVRTISTLLRDAPDSGNS